MWGGGGGGCGRYGGEPRPQQPTECSDPTQHAKGRTGSCPGPRKERATRRNVTQGGFAPTVSPSFDNCLQRGILCIFASRHKLQQKGKLKPVLVDPQDPLGRIVLLDYSSVVDLPNSVQEIIHQNELEIVQQDVVIGYEQLTAGAISCASRGAM